MAVKAWLAKNGADVTRVNFIEMPTAAMVAAVERGTVAGAHFGEPFLSASGNAVKRVAAPYDAVGKSFLISDWFATRTWLSANAAAGYMEHAQGRFRLPPEQALALAVED